MFHVWTRVACVAAIMGACALPDDPEVGASEQPLIGGTLAEDDPAVIALTSTNSRPFCTGTLVSPSVVLTAAHCIDMAGGDPNITIFFGTDTYGDGTKIGVKKTGRHPGWNGNLGQYDIGLMLMNYPADPELAVPLNTSPASDHIDDAYRVVGFGQHQAGQNADGKKREGTTTISGITGGDIIVSGDDMISVCFGDSGGPGFLTIDEVEYVAGVHSYTSGQDCNPPNGDTRVDPYVDDFILPWIQDNDPTCGEDGLCAKSGCLDDPDCEPCGPDGTCTDDCPLPDPDCPTSELGEICQADTQCTTGLCVFWEAETSTRFCSRECDPGAGDCPAGMSCRSVQPFGDVCYYDDDPPGVLGSACSEATDCGSYLCDEGRCVTRCDVAQGVSCPEGFECAASSGGEYFCYGVDDGDSGGCDAGGSGTGLLGGLLLWLALAALGRLRARPRARA